MVLLTQCKGTVMSCDKLLVSMEFHGPLQWDLHEVHVESFRFFCCFCFHTLGINICSLLHRVKTTHGPKAGYRNVFLPL